MTQRELRAKLIERFPRQRTFLLPALHYVQHELGHLPEWALQVVGWHLHIPASEVYGAATSYTGLRPDAIGAKPGRHVVRVCTGLACWLNGASAVLDAARPGAEAKPGETSVDSPEGGITLEEAACAFMCALAPVAGIDGAWRGRVRPHEMRGLVTRLSSVADGASASESAE